MFRYKIFSVFMTYALVDALEALAGCSIIHIRLLNSISLELASVVIDV